MRLIWHTLALKDLEQIVKYCHHNFGKQTARKVKDKYSNDIYLLKHQPYLGFIEPSLKKVGTLEYHSLVISCTKVIYTIHTEYIFIHILWDCRRNPEDLHAEIDKRKE